LANGKLFDVHALKPNANLVGVGP
jgi:hypothetical protein